MRTSLLLIALMLLPTLSFAELPKEFQSKLSYQDGVNAALEINGALSKVPQLQKAGPAVIKKQTVLLCDLVKKLDAPGMMTTEAMVGSIVKLIEFGVSPVKIFNTSEAFQTMLVKLNGLNASTEVVVKMTEEWAKAIKQGGKAGAQTLIKLEALTEGNRQKFISLSNPNDRYNLVQKEMIKHFVNFDEE
jgi:hypothetical protein